MATKHYVYAIVDRRKEAFRPSLVCVNKPRIIENGQLKTPASNFILTFDQQGISTTINEDHPLREQVMKIVEGVYKPDYNKDEKKPVLIGPFEGATPIAARNEAIKAQLKLRPKTVEEVAAMAEARAAEAEKTIAQRDEEIAALKQKLEKSGNK